MQTNRDIKAPGCLQSRVQGGDVGDEVGRGQKVEAWDSVSCSVVEARTE